MAISYDEYVNKKKKKKKEEPKVVLGYSKNQNNVNNTPRSTTNTQTLIDRYIAEQKTKGDIAPVKKKEGDGLFSAFNDGYQLGDVSKTILKGGTKLGKAVYETGKEFVTNPVQTVKTGIVGIGEGLNKANDLTNDAVGDFFDFITGREKDKDEISINITELDRFSKTASKEEKQKVLKQYEKKYGKDSAMYKSVEVTLNAKQDKEDKNILTMKYYDTDTHKKAVEGELSEGQQNIYEIGQTVGNIIPATVVSTTLGPLAGKALFFTQAQQGYTEEALARGYSEKEARTYGLIMGGFEVAVERLGFDELGGLNKLASGNIIKNMAGEGLEEFVMPYIDDVVTYMGFEDGYSWEKFRESSEEALEGAVMGAVVGGIFSAGGKGLQKVDNVIQKAGRGETVTQHELIEARDELQEKSPETVREAVIGVAEQIKNVESIGGKQEVEELGGKQEDITSEDIAPIPEELDVVERLNENNIPILEGNEYQASTDETALKSQNYVYQASETDSTYRRNLNEDATKYANNTTRTHEFVNTLSNISEATGLNIRLTNNTSPEMTQRKQAMINSYAKRNNISVQEASERLKNIVIDGYNVNDQITINVNSPKALNRLVGHEITHSLEKTGEYKKNLQKIAIEYAKTKNDYKSRLDRLMDLYAGQNADINKELTADIIGDYLFTDQKFVDSIYKKDRNLFQRIYDEIKHLFKMATAGSKEARQLEKLKHSFEKAMRENKEMSNESKKATVQETKDKSAVEVESNTQEKEDSVEVLQTTAKELQTTAEKTETSNVTESVEAETKTEEYSLSNVDSEGNKLSEEQIEFFKYSVVRDENGNLIVVYHTMTHEGVQFNEFNPVGTPGYKFGDQIVIYFTNSKEMSGSYADQHYVMADTTKFNGIEEVNKYQYEGYLNITNPYIVEADGNNWNQASQEFSENIKERFESLTPEERESLIKLSSQGKLAIRPVLERANANTDTENGFSYYGTKYSSEDVKNLASAYVKLREGAGMTPTYDSIYSVAEQRFKQMWIESASVVNFTTNDIVRRVLEENKHGSNYDGVIIKDVVDYGSEQIGDPEPNDVYVVFNSNQFKAKDNKKPTEDSDIRYSLTRASMKQVEQATELEKQDKTPEEIYLETGAYRGAEGLWRTEIDDSRATVKISSAMVGGKYKLKEILDFPKLYKAYPGFEEMTVIFDDNMLPSELGKYNPDTNTLTINSSVYDYKQAELLSAKKQLADWENTVKTYEVLFSEEQIDQHLESLKDKAKKYKRKDYQKELKSTLLHEIQHVIQEKEGLSSGASPSYWREKQLITEQYREAYRQKEKDLYVMMDMDKFFDEMMTKAKDMSWEEFQQAKEDFIDNSEYGQQYRDLQELMEKTKKRYEILTGRSAYELYRDTAGEEEARDVQNRMDWSSKDRKRFMPYAGGRETVFYEGFENEKKYGVMFNQADDIRYSLSVSEANTTKDNKGRKLSKAVIERNKDSKTVDENGNLITVYHTTTNERVQFNEFNPVGTSYYRFGDQVVNYYTNSKDMSGSYANYHYEMADTKKLNNLDEAREWLKQQNTIFDNYDIKQRDGMYFVINNDREILHYYSEATLLRGVKEGLYSWNRVQYKSQKGYAKYQYEGYANITNPYVVDAEGRGWKYVGIEFNDNKQRDLNKITSDQNKVKALEKLANDSWKRHEEYDFSGDEWTYYHYKNTADAIIDRELNEAVQFSAMFGYEYNDYAKMHENLPSGDSTITDLTSDLTETNYNMFKDMTLSDFVRVYAQEYEKNLLYGKEESYFKHEYKNITGELKELPASDLYKIARKHFTEDSISDAIVEYSSTNDVVHQVIEMNKNGSNYDGIIMKNVVDYGEGGGKTPADLFVTFNSNQFKAWDNENPTDDPDIRYSLSDSKGRELSPQQQEYFKDSKARDSEGNLLTLYHGTYNSEMFTVFDPKQGFNVDAIYLTPDLNVSSVFGNGSSIRNFDKTLIPRINEAKTVEDLMAIFRDDLNNIMRVQKTFSDEKGDNYVLVSHNDMASSPLGYKTGENTYKQIRFDGTTKETNLFDKLKTEALETASENQIYASNYEVYANIINPLTVDAKGKPYHRIEFEGKTTNTETISVIAKERGYDGVIVKNVLETGYENQLTDDYIVFNSNQIKDVKNQNPTDNPDINMSLSRTDDVAPVGENDIFGSDIAVQEQVKEAIAPLQEQIETLTETISALQENMAPASFDLVEEQRAETQRTMTDEDAPLTDEGTFSFLDDEVKIKKKNEIINEIASDFNIKKTEARELYNKIESIPELTIDDVYTELENYRKVKFKEQDDYIKSIQDYIKGTRLDISEIKKQIPDYGNVYRMSNMGKGLILGNSGQSIDSFYQELNELYPNEFPGEVTAEADQLELISQAMFKEKELTYTDVLDDDELQILAERIYADIGNSERYRHTQSGLYFLNQEVKKMAPPGEINTNISEEEYADSLSTLNASNTEQIEENVSLDEELNKLDRQKGPSIKKNPFDEVLDKFLEGQRPGKTTATPKVEKSKYRNFRDTTQRLFVNEMVETDNLAKETGNLNIKYKGDMLNNVAGEIEGEIYTAQTDNEGHAIGKSLSELFAPAKEKGLYDAFNDYLEHYSNIDRHAQGKGSVVPLEESRRLVSHYERTYPEFKQWGKDVWQYGANVRDNLIDAGIISEEQAEALGTMYPHYVPYMENREMSNYNPDLGEIKPKGVIKRATGGAKNLLPIEEALIKYTFGYKKAIRQNQFYQEIVSTLEDKVEVGADVRTDPIELDDTLYKDETGNYLTAYFNGERQSVRISDDLYTGLKNDLKGQIRGLEEKFALITEPVQKLSEIRRNLLTSWNPMFIIKNPIMDIQDALFNSKHTKGFIKHYNIKTFIELANRSTETARQFLTLYGSGNVMGEHSSDGTVKNKNFLKGIQKANNIMELAPRYAEFKASLENGASLEEALYNAREVTTNFGRGGVITKALNKNGFTFLNVSVQGFDKFIRNFSGENGAKGVAGALLKASVLGVIPAIFNELAFGGDDEEKDEDYDALPDYIKDNYYLIKTGDGQFIRIPKGRMLSVFGSAGRRTLEYLQGEEDAFDGFLKNAYSQVGISNPLDSNILTPLIQAYGSENGEAWYGGDLVPTRLQGKAPEEQYDSSTDKFSIWLGDKLGISPYKLNYVIDQYSGGVGDIFLPFITEESTSDAEGVGMILAPIKDQFTANSTSDNKYAGDIYDLSDKMDKMPTATKETDDYKIKDAYLYSVTSEMGKLYAERRAVQENKKLSKKEKYEKVQAIQKQINDLAKEGLDNYQNVSKTDNYAIVGGREFNKYKTESGETRWGAVREEELEALNSYGLDLMEKSSYFNAKTYISKAQERYKNTEDYTQKKRDIISVIRSTLLTDEAKAYLYDKYYGNADTLNAITTLGIDFDKYLDLEYQNFEADKNSEGKSISGSKKAKVFNYINSMDLSFEEKVILTKLQYNSYDEHNGAVINYINNYDMTYEQRVNILEKLGFKVDEYGNIFW